jgi:hypothetical protein
MLVDSARTRLVVYFPSAIPTQNFHCACASTLPCFEVNPSCRRRVAMLPAGHYYGQKSQDRRVVMGSSGCESETAAGVGDG